MSGREKVEQLFRKQFKSSGIDTENWQCIVRIVSQDATYTYYYLKFYWSNGSCIIDHIYSKNGQIVSYDPPELLLNTYV